VEVANVKDRVANRIESYPYNDQVLPVKDVSIRWLSKAGPDGSPNYGLRYFTIGPEGEIPVHSHAYLQTMYILTGTLDVCAHDAQSDAIIDRKQVRPSDFVFVPSMEPHSMRNPSSTDSVTLLCCIGNASGDRCL
jgi:quercetin dioxygenase-like cupin family protein